MNVEIELAIANEAAAYCVAALELNPYGEAEFLEIGSARAVYSGVNSSVHGVFALGLDGPVEERDFQEIERFYARKERHASFWVTPFTDPSLMEFLGKFHITKSQTVFADLLVNIPTTEATGNNTPDFKEWSDSFAKIESALAAATRLHEKNLRFYLEKESASFSFFHQGIALIPILQKNLFAKQTQDAKKFQSKMIAHIGEGSLPFLYERKLYERI